MFELTKRELIESIIAFIVLSICFAISNVKFDVHGFISIFPVVMIGAGIGCVSHEFGHKFMAMRYGYKAEFRLWPIGLLIAFVTSFFGIVIALPGEARIYAEDLSDEIVGRIAVAGPMLNIAFGLIFIVIAVLIYPLTPYSDLLYFLSADSCHADGSNHRLWYSLCELLPRESQDGVARRCRLRGL